MAFFGRKMVSRAQDIITHESAFSNSEKAYQDLCVDETSEVLFFIILYIFLNCFYKKEITHNFLHSLK